MQAAQLIEVFDLRKREEILKKQKMRRMVGLYVLSFQLRQSKYLQCLRTVEKVW
jgi:hypothetical protein